MVRLSIGIENAHDIIHDIEQALEKVPVYHQKKQLKELVM
jgi:hypothetical protein